MKKLMIAAAIVCAAVMAEAAEANPFKWLTSSDIYMPTTLANITVGENQAKGSGSTRGISRWLPNGTTPGATFVATILLTDTTPGGSGASVYTTAGVDGPTDIPMAYATNKASVPNLENSLFTLPSSGSKNLHAEIIITGTYVKDGYTYTITSSPIEKDIELTSASTMQLSTGVPASWSITRTGADPIPEPTSGLLLLLGVAGLALKRKRA